MKTARSRAEMQFAAAERQAKRTQAEQKTAMQERSEHIARLRALRLAKEACERARAGIATGTPAEAEDKCSST